MEDKETTEISNYLGSAITKTKTLLEEQVKKFEELSLTDKVLLVIGIYLVYKMFKKR